MSYRKWSRIRLPVRSIAPLGGGPAGCYFAQGDDNNQGRGVLGSATHNSCVELATLPVKVSLCRFVTFSMAIIGHSNILILYFL